MTEADFSNLSGGQRDCLRLVFDGWSIKEIATELGLSISTVNQRLDRARRILGASSSKEAARRLAAYERPETIWILRAGSENPLRIDATMGSVGTSDELDETVRDTAGNQNKIGDLQQQPPLRSTAVPWPLPTQGRSMNDLNLLRRVIVVLCIAGGSMIALLLLALLTISFQDIAGSHL